MPTPQQDPVSQPGRKPQDQSWDHYVEELIRKAQERGDFDNLRGHGKPLPDWRNPYLPETNQMAFDLIRNSGHTLPWLDDSQDIERRIEAARRKLRRDYDWYREQQSAGKDDPGGVAAIWQRNKQAFEREIAEINRQIDTYNLKAPSAQLHKFRLILAEELEAIE